jgi:DNA-binding transcriptional MocR family regulator
MTRSARSESSSGNGRPQRRLHPRANSGANSVPGRPLADTEFVQLLSDWSRGDGPLYALLAERIAALMDEGTVREGVRLPSERALAAALSVSRRTVEAAYDQLQSLDLVGRRTGVGTWAKPRTVPVSGRRRRTAASFVDLLLSGSRPLDLAVAALPAHELVIESRYAAEVESLQRTTHGYHPSGLDELREQVCAWFGRLGAPTSPDQIAITSGAAQALWIAASLLSPGSDVAVESPTSPTILTALRAHPLRLRPTVTDDHGLVPNELPAGLGGAVFVTSTYLNPTGAQLTWGRCRQLAERATAGLLVVEDLAMADIRLDGPRPQTVAAAAPEAPVVSIGSMSKLYWAGLRVGWLRGPAGLIRRINQAKAMLDLSAPPETQARAAWLLERHADVRRDRLPELRRYRDDLHARLADRLPEWRAPIPAGGMSLWTTLPADLSTSLCNRMLRRGVRLLPATAFDVHGRDERHLRLPFVLPPAVNEVIVERLADAAERD